MRTYSTYSDLIDCNVGDKVYVYSGEVVGKSGNINSNMIGTVEYIEQKLDSDWMGFEYLSYHVEIRLNNGLSITIKDEDAQPKNRQYEFITLKDLRENYGIEV
jgi:hypothetical protein